MQYDFESLEDGDLTQRKMEATAELMYGMGDLPISYPIAIARLQIVPGFTWVLGTWTPSSCVHSSHFGNWAVSPGLGICSLRDTEKTS